MTLATCFAFALLCSFVPQDPGAEPGAGSPAPQEPAAASATIGADVWRYESAQRVRAMERAWAAADEEARADAVDEIERAVAGFFRGGVADVVAQLDAARFELDPAAAARERESWRYACVPSARVLEVGTDTLTVECVPLYGDGSRTVAIGLGLTAVTGAGGVSSGSSEPKRAFDLPIAGLGAGTYDVDLSLSAAGEAQVRAAGRIELVVDLHARLEALRTRIGRRSQLPATIAAHTAFHCRELVDELAAGATLEIDYPAARLLRAAEVLSSGVAEVFTSWIAAPGERWLRVPLERGHSIVRLFVPDGLDPGGLDPEGRVPIVFALHGAGGSENMFFEGYGAGLAVELARERGWILVAPRVGFLGSPVVELVDALAPHLPIDADNVFVVGHSMGAMAAVKAVTADAARFRAWAALGGAGPVDAALAAVPAFLAAGASDFGKGGVDRLAAQLSELEHADLVHRTYANTEHLLIVQRALPDVFAFFDAHRAGAADSDG